MLPCNVVVQETGAGKIEVAAIDPVASMQAIDNPRLRAAAQKVQARMSTVMRRALSLHTSVRGREVVGTA